MPSIVACSHYIKEKKSCYILLLSNVYRQCYYNSIKTYLLANILLLDFSKINHKLEKLKKQEEAIKAQQDANKKLITEAQERLQVLRSKIH
jgi:TfoX/Sxy family transcriptional regulator of competence genes